MTKAPYKHLYLVDGSGYIFRAYFAIPPRNTSDGTPTNATFGFTNMLVKLLRDSDADAIAVIFDKSGKTFRNEIYPEYKAHRPEPPEDLIPQFAAIREATRAFNLPCIELQNYEADDLIATYARQAREAGIEVTVVSSDKDLMQLVDGGIAMLDPMKDRKIGYEEVKEKFGVTPDKVVDVQALAGDSTDNVPGVPGIGVKTAAQLIEEYGDLESLLARAGEIKQPKRREKLIENAELARISKQLVTLDQNAPVEVDLKDFGLRQPEPEDLRAFLERYEFRSLLRRLSDQIGGAEEIATPAEAAPESAKEASYELVQDMAALERWVAAAQVRGVIAVDTETTSLDPLAAELVGVSLSTAPGQACYIPLGHRAADTNDGGLDFDGAAEAPKQIPLKKAIAALKPLLEDPGVLKVGQNIKYDMLVFARQGISVAPIDDTMLLSYVVEGGLHGHGMDELAQLHLDYQTIKFKEVAGSGKNQVTFDKVPLDKALDYAAEDADITLRLYDVLKPRLVSDRLTTVYETIERPLVQVLAEMELTGIKVDRATLHRMSNDFAKRIDELQKQIYKLAGREFTIGSPKQLGEILFDEMSLPGGKKGKSGAYATGADILEGLANQGHDLPARVLDWRHVSKLKSTYTDALQNQINEETGRVHTSYSQAVASTGRLSSNDPNLQNIPVRTEEGRKIRTAFVAEKDHVLLSVDYSQIELRLTAHIAEVDALKQAFHEGQDIHAITASQVFGVPIEGMDPMTRRKAKAINFGIIYGISAFGLAQNLGIAQGEAKAYIDAYFERYPGIRDYMDKMKKAAREQGFVTTLFGRKIHVPGIKDKNPARRSFSERAAINAPIQGTAADIIKRAMIRVVPALEDAKLGARMLLQVHDELLLEVPKDEVDDTSALVREVMENACAPAVELSVPLTADAGTGANWAEAH
ncbi:DNA polymerase I [Pelagibius marinus]|uniref:DNA polymerase I n=1 Tax=Pelagibius marinus TaxID=2762760 RepID=UPI0018733B03|nr:DNA polymerase I [Pelagibius marinus]